MKRLNIIIVITSLFLSACGSNSYVSKIPQNKIVIDGKLNDWSGDLKYIKDEEVAIGIKNNKNFLFISFTTAERNKIMQIFNMGFTVWLKPSNSKILGFQYPLKSEEQPEFNIRMRNRPKLNSSKMIKNHLKKHNEFLIINDDNFPLYGAKIGANTGYQISLGFHNGKFIYELRIPFKKYADKNIPIIKIPENKLEIVFETGEFERKLFGNKGIGAGAGGRRGGGRGGIGIAGPRRGNFNITEKIEISISVNLN